MKGYRWGLRRRRLWVVGFSNYLGMKQLIRDSLTFDFGWVSSVIIGITGWQYEDMVKKGDKAFATWYAQKENVLESDTGKFLAAFEE